MDNSTAWSEVYDTSEFGNKYPSSYLVSLFHSRIKPILLKSKNSLGEINVLDFGCSIGANSKVYQDMGINTYGIDVSERVIERLIRGGVGDADHFKAINLLKADIELDSVFPGVKFDFIIASECMYYFKNLERQQILEKMMRSMSKDAILYVSMPTYDVPLYKAYKDIAKDKDGMVEVKESGSIKHSLFVNLPRSREELEDMFKPFKTIDIMTVNAPIYSEEDMVEYHLITTI